MHGQGQPRRPPRAEQAEGADPGGAGADRGHAGDRRRPRRAAAAAGHAAGAGPHQEPAAAEIQRPVHVRQHQGLAAYQEPPLEFCCRNRRPLERSKTLRWSRRSEMTRHPHRSNAHSNV